MNLNLSKFKKIKESDSAAILQHPSGHKFILHKGALKPEHLKELSEMPTNEVPAQKFASGGDVEDQSNQSASNPQQPIININIPGSNASQDVLNKAASPDVSANRGPEGLSSRAPTDEEIAAQKSSDQAPENYMTNGTFDTNKWIMANPDKAPLNSQTDILQNQNQNSQLQQKASYDQQNALRNQILAYNDQAAKAGLPLKEVPPELGGSPAMATMPVPGAGDSTMPAMAQQPSSLQMPSIDDYYKQQQGDLKNVSSAINENTAAQQSAYQSQAKTYQDIAAQKEGALSDFKNTSSFIQGELENISKEMRDPASQINPNHFWQSKSAMGKVGTVIGLMLGGFSAGWNKTGNQNLSLLENLIDKDVDAQKVNLENKKNIFNAYQDQFKNSESAADMSRLVLSSIAADKISQATATAGSAQAKLNGANALQALHKNMFDLQNQIAIRQGLMNSMKGVQGSGQDMGQFLNYLRIMNPEMAKSYEGRYVPGVGLSSVPVPDKVRDEITSREALDKAVGQLRNFAQTHTGQLAGPDKVYGETLAKLVQDEYRSASGQGVFREAEKNFVEGIVDQEPTKFFNSWRTDPKYKALEENNLLRLNQTKQNYGLPVRYVPPSRKSL